MDLLIDSFLSALRLVVTMDREMMEIVGVSLRVSLTSTLIAGIIGIPLGFTVAHGEFRGRRMCVTILNTLLALPTVVIGLFV